MLRLSIISQGVAMRAAKCQASGVSETAEQAVRMIVQAAEFLCDLGIKVLLGGAGSNDAAAATTIPSTSKL